MRLYEYEGKKLLTEIIAVPNSMLISTVEESKDWHAFPCIIKLQTLFGNRKEKGLIRFAANSDELEKHIRELLTEPSAILIEEQIQFEQESYLAIRYDTALRSPVLLFSAQGGSGIEGRGDLDALLIDPIAAKLATKKKVPIDIKLVEALINVFFQNDCTLLEINPLVKNKDHFWALDAKVELDDTAQYRHPEWKNYPPRTLFSRPPTSMEQQAKEINAMDHRGSAGASFFEFDGSIGVLASGGGASLVAMDGLLASGLRPANYTEYSGNPTREKVRELSKLVLTKKGLEALWVVGGNANFTDIHETLSGVMDAIEEAKLPEGFPVVVRRGGPRWEEAFASLKERSKKTKIELQLFGPDFPMLETTAVLVKAVEKYVNSNK